MTDIPATPRTRRAVLTAGIGAAAAAAVGTFARPGPVRGVTPDGGVSRGLFNETTGTTSIVNAGTTSSTVLSVQHGSNGIAVTGVSESSIGVDGFSTSGTGGRGRSSLESGIVGYSGYSASTSRAQTGVVGTADVGTASVGVFGASPAGTGGLFSSTNGLALHVQGKARFNRSGKASVGKGTSSVDVVVPGGLAANSIISATIQMYRAGVSVAGVRPNYPTAGKARIYLTKVASTTATTPVAWFVTEYGS